MTKEEGFVFRCCGLDQLDNILDVEREAIDSLERPDMLRHNTIEMWKKCLQPPHYCMGAWIGEELVAFAVLYVPQKGDVEDLAVLVEQQDTADIASANFKICIVKPQWRGRHLQVRLGRRLHEEAGRRGYRLLCATASPHNAASIKSLIRLGYHADHMIEKYGFERVLFHRVN